MMQKGIIESAAYFVATALEHMCTIKDKFEVLTRIEVLLFGQHCVMAMWSYRIADRYKLGMWTTEVRGVMCFECCARYTKEFVGRGCLVCGKSILGR